jgi:hypothetical protein
VRAGAFVHLVRVGGRRAAEGGGQRLLARRVLGIGQPQLGEALPERVPQVVDAAAHARRELAVVLVPPGQELAGVPDAGVVDLHRLGPSGEAVHRRFARHDA